MLAQGIYWTPPGGNPYDNAPFHLFDLLNPRLSAIGAADSEGFGCVEIELGTLRPAPAAVKAYSYPGNHRRGVPVSQRAEEMPESPAQTVGLGKRTTGPNLFVYFDGPWTNGSRAQLTSATLRSSRGSVALRWIDNTTSNLLPPTGAILVPAAPLKPATTYRVSVRGTVTGVVPGSSMEQALCLLHRGGSRRRQLRAAAEHRVLRRLRHPARRLRPRPQLGRLRGLLLQDGRARAQALSAVAAPAIRWAQGPGDVEGAIAVRERVFVDEQGVPVEEELDGRDDEALHLVALDPDGERVIGTLRLLFDGETVKVGRVAVDRELAPAGDRGARCSKPRSQEARRRGAPARAARLAARGRRALRAGGFRRRVRSLRGSRHPPRLDGPRAGRRRVSATRPRHAHGRVTIPDHLRLRRRARRLRADLERRAGRDARRAGAAS